MKKLKELLFEDSENDIKPAMASANSLLMMDKLKNNPSFMAMLTKIQLPSDKYNAIKKFAGLLGIPDERFNDFITQQENRR